MVVLDAVMCSHKDERGKEGSEERDEEEKAVKDGSGGEMASRLETPGHRRIVNDQSPREVGFGWGGHVEEVNSQGVWGKSIEHAVTIGIAVVIIVETIDVELNRRGPPCHDIEFPLPVAYVRERRGDIRIESQSVELSSSKEPWDTAGYIISIVGMYDGGGRASGLRPI